MESQTNRVLRVRISCLKLKQRILQNELILLEKIPKRSLWEPFSSWGLALTSFDARFLKKFERRSNFSIEIPDPSYEFAEPRISDLEMHEIAMLLDVSSLYKAGAACRRLHRSFSSSLIWKWRPLDLGHITSYKAWTGALRTHGKSKHWIYCTTVRAPPAKSVMIAAEVLSFFGRRLVHLDLRCVDHLSLMDYVFLIPERFKASLLQLQTTTLPSEEETTMEVDVVGRIFREVIVTHGLQGVDRIL
jgi:hypothetical protein